MSTPTCPCRRPRPAPSSRRRAQTDRQLRLVGRELQRVGNAERNLTANGPSFEIDHAHLAERSTTDVCGLTVVRDGELMRARNGHPPEDVARARVESDDLARSVAGEVERVPVLRKDACMHPCVGRIRLAVPSTEQRVRGGVHDRDHVRAVQAEGDEVAAHARVHVVRARARRHGDPVQNAPSGLRRSRSPATHRTPRRRRACLSRTPDHPVASRSPCSQSRRRRQSSCRSRGSCSPTRGDSRPRSFR